MPYVNLSRECNTRKDAMRTPPLDQDYRATAIDPVLKKVEQLLALPDARCAIGTVTNTIHFGEMMDTGKVFIANLSKGRLGPIHAQLLGALLTSQFLAAAMHRGETQPNENKRVPFFLVVDEAGAFTTDAFADTVSEARKYKLSLFSRTSSAGSYSRSFDLR